MLTGLLFQLPGLVIMTLVGVGAASFLKTPAPWLRGATAGLGAAGVALVAASAFALTRGACRGDGLLLSLSAASAVVTFYTVKIWLFPVLILAGGLVTLAVNAYRRKDMAAKTSGDDEAHVERFGLPRAAGALVVVLWAAVLVATLVAASKVPDFPMSKSSLGLDLWSAMFRAGSMIFGGEFFSPNVFPPMFFRFVGAEAFFSFLISFFLRLSKKKKKKNRRSGRHPFTLQRRRPARLRHFGQPSQMRRFSRHLGLELGLLPRPLGRARRVVFFSLSFFPLFFRRSPSLFISSLSFSLTSSFSPSLLLPLPLPSLPK
jgi:chromate transport protein ChrA